MSSNTSKPSPKPVPPSSSPGNPINKGPAPLPPSPKPGSGVPFGEPAIKTIK